MTVANSMQPTERKPTLFARQRELLSLLAALGGSCGKLDFQKLLFLYCQERGEDAPYHFVPYRFGAFSFTSYADRRKLKERGLLADLDNWQLTPAGRALLPPISVRLQDFAKRYRVVRDTELVRETYERFPYYATRSEIVGEVLKGDSQALARVQAQRKTSLKPALQTIGYEGHSLESYLNRLLKAGTSVLCDVRRNPLSRKYGFSKKTLATACTGVGIRYEHLPALGIASDKRKGLATQDDYDALFTEYERDSLPAQGESLGIIRGWIEAGDRVALTCFEHLPEQCHRHCVADALHAEFGEDFAAAHL